MPATQEKLPRDTKKQYFALQNFKGIDTKSDRTVISEEEFAWLENVMPVGNGNLRCVPGPTSIAATWGAEPVTVADVNILGNAYIVAFESDGRAEAFRIGTQTISQIAAPGTLSNAGVSAAMWQNTNLIVTDPQKGSFSWDGTNWVSLGSVGLITLTANGSGYTTAPTVTISAPNQAGGTQATATASIGSATSTGTVTGVSIIAPGAGYTSVPLVNFSSPPSGGTQAQGVAQLSNGSVVFVQITNAGAGYTQPPTVTFTGGGPTTAASASATISSGPVIGVTLTEAGTGYTSPPTITFSGGGGSGAAATAQTINQSGSAVAVFSGHLWIAQGRTIYYSVAGSYSDFISISSGNVILTDSVFFGTITALVAANSYLYIFGPNAINILSDVGVNTVGATVFTNTNVSASIGTNLPNAVFAYFRSLLFMNTYGVYALVGATTTKISDPLDGIFPYIDFTKPVTATQFVINSTLCAAFGFTYAAPNTTPRFLMAIFFDKKWWLASQGDAIRIINAVPINGIETIYAMTPTNVIACFTNASTRISATIKTALLSFKNPVQDKQLLKFSVASIGIAANSPVTIENETGLKNVVTLKPSGFRWIDGSGNTFTWLDNAGHPFTWVAKSYQMNDFDATMYGKFIGATLCLSDATAIINAIYMQYEMRATF